LIGAYLGESPKIKPADIFEGESMSEYDVWQQELHEMHHRLAEALGIPPTGPNTMDWEGLLEVVKNLRGKDRDPQAGEPPEVIAQRVEEYHRWDEELRIRCFRLAWEIAKETSAPYVKAPDTSLCLDDITKALIANAAEVYAFSRGAPPPDTELFAKEQLSRPVNVHVVGDE
jgi:hypothetical protein